MECIETFSLELIVLIFMLTRTILIDKFQYEILYFQREN